MERLSGDSERIIKLMTPNMKKYLTEINQQPPYNFSLMRGIPNRIHRNFGKMERKKKMLHELLNRGFIRHFWFMRDELSLVMDQECFIEYYDKHLSLKE